MTRFQNNKKKNSVKLGKRLLLGGLYLVLVPGYSGFLSMSSSSGVAGGVGGGGGWGGRRDVGFWKLIKRHRGANCESITRHHTPVGACGVCVCVCVCVCVSLRASLCPSTLAREMIAFDINQKRKWWSLRLKVAVCVTEFFFSRVGFFFVVDFS